MKPFPKKFSRPAKNKNWGRGALAALLLALASGFAPAATFAAAADVDASGTSLPGKSRVLALPPLRAPHPVLHGSLPPPNEQEEPSSLL